MAIPDYQTLMLPLLSLISDGKEYVFNPLVDVLADEFNLTELERQQLLPSGAMTTIKNRAGWARTYLKKAGLLDQPSRGVIKITQIGSSVLDNKPQKIDVKFLEQYESFVTFRDASKLEVPNVAIEASPTFKVLEALSTPEEILADTHQKLNAQLASELLETIKVGTPDFFERLVVKVLVSIGYGGTLANAARVIGRSGDGGIDGIIDEDRLGLDSIYIQAKRWEGVVGRPEIQKFVGALQGQRAHKGVFITTSDFTKEAQEYVKNISNKVVLMNGFALAKLMIENNVGVSIAATYEVKKIDSDYFVDE